MADYQLALTAEERVLLVELLESTQKETRIEEHRTRAPTYREHVVNRSDMLSALLEKLGKPQST